MSNPPPVPPDLQQSAAGQPLQYATPYNGISNGVTCPRCARPAGQKVSFTWWGGLIGPKMLNHTKCTACNYTYNARTGQPNTTGIAIYVGVSLLVGILLFFFLIMSK